MSWDGQGICSYVVRNDPVYKVRLHLSGKYYSCFFALYLSLGIVAYMLYFCYHAMYFLYMFIISSGG